jgi:hypothetical protein
MTTQKDIQEKLMKEFNSIVLLMKATEKSGARHEGYMPIILATREAEIGRTGVQPGQKIVKLLQKSSWVWWYMPVVPAAQEVKVGRHS